MRAICACATRRRSCMWTSSPLGSKTARLITASSLAMRETSPVFARERSASIWTASPYALPRRRSKISPLRQINTPMPLAWPRAASSFARSRWHGANTRTPKRSVRQTRGAGTASLEGFCPSTRRRCCSRASQSARSLTTPRPSTKSLQRVMRAMSACGRWSTPRQMWAAAVRSCVLRACATGITWPHPSTS